MLTRAVRYHVLGLSLQLLLVADSSGWGGAGEGAGASVVGGAGGGEYSVRVCRSSEGALSLDLRSTQKL